jgi:predicted O-methyltransferase YrrM
MNDERWTVAPKVIDGLMSDTLAAGFGMASDPLTCSSLRTLATGKPGGRFLELGTGTGLSTSWLLDGMDPASRLTTVDNDDALLCIARHHLGGDARLEIVCSDGDAFLLKQDGSSFDFIFADTWSGKYQLLEKALALLAPGGMYVVDDMLPQPNWPTNHANKVEHLLDTLSHHPDLHVSKLSWASGVVIATRRA